MSTLISSVKAARTVALAALVLASGLSTGTVRAQEPAAGDVEAARRTAVALNYCRASLHRIRTNPTPEVLAEERTRILDNLSLDSIADAEVIGLYSALLDEIGQIERAGVRRQMTHTTHTRDIRRKAVWDAVAFAGHVATAQYVTAVRTGADSWWDLRDRRDRRDRELFTIEEKRMESVVSKSQLFLDTCWKLARRRDIPDAWLVRGSDLDRLAAVVSDEDLEARERRLRRLEPFLAAYPPYHYHLARTQQAVGDFRAAVVTYAKLAELEAGQFRVDEMLAAAEANHALLLDQAGDPAAPDVAERALAHAPDVWQANLVAARVLEKHGRTADAEDALLRNLDADLERPISQTTRLALHYRAGHTERLAELLGDDRVLAEVPATAVLRCLAKIPEPSQPPAALAKLGRSIAAYPRLTFGGDELVISADAAWRLPDARWSFPVLAGVNTAPQLRTIRGGHAVRFAKGVEWGHPFEAASVMNDLTVDVVLDYPDGSSVSLTLKPAGRTAFKPDAAGRNARPVLTLSAVRVDDTRVSFGRAGRHARVETLQQAALPDAGEWEIQ